MDELTLELFGAVMGTDELDEDRKGLVYAWLTTVLRLHYLTDREKKNAGILLEFLEGVPGGEVFQPLYRAVRAKLSFEVPPKWDMDWPENYQVSVGGEELTVDDLRKRGIDYVDFRLTKPIRSATEFVLVRRLHADGTVEFLPEYQVFQAAPIGERHVFNVYGEKAVTR